MAVTMEPIAIMPPARGHIKMLSQTADESGSTLSPRLSKTTSVPVDTDITMDRPAIKADSIPLARLSSSADTVKCPPAADGSALSSTSAIWLPPDSPKRLGERGHSQRPPTPCTTESDATPLLSPRHTSPAYLRKSRFSMPGGVGSSTGHHHGSSGPDDTAPCPDSSWPAPATSSGSFSHSATSLPSPPRRSVPLGVPLTATGVPPADLLTSPSFSELPPRPSDGLLAAERAVRRASGGVCLPIPGPVSPATLLSFASRPNTYSKFPSMGSTLGSDALDASLRSDAGGLEVERSNGTLRSTLGSSAESISCILQREDLPPLMARTSGRSPARLLDGPANRPNSSTIHRSRSSCQRDMLDMAVAATADVIDVLNLTQRGPGGTGSGGSSITASRQRVQAIQRSLTTTGGANGRSSPSVLRQGGHLADSLPSAPPFMAAGPAPPQLANQDSLSQFMSSLTP